MYRRITENILRLYIEGNLESEQIEFVEKEIRESKDVFERYIELREALFLSGRGEPANENFKERILDIVEREKHATTSPSLPHLKIIIRKFRDKIIVLDGSQNKIDFRGVSASFAYRSSDDEAGPVSISRKIGGRELTFILTPVTPEEYSLSVSPATNEPLEVRLYLEKKELEIIPDLSQKKIFNAYIPSNGSVELVFKKDGKDIFTVDFRMESDGGGYRK